MDHHQLCEGMCTNVFELVCRCRKVAVCANRRLLRRCVLNGRVCLGKGATKMVMIIRMRAGKLMIELDYDVAV